MADSKQANATNLDNFLEDIFDTRLDFSQSNVEVQIVQQLVHEMVNNIVTEAYSPGSGFTVRKVIPVGSMAEGTRIIEPNEFDFMIVVDKFDADDIMEIISDWDGTFLSLKTECKCNQENCYVLKEPDLSIHHRIAFGCDHNLVILGETMARLLSRAIFKLYEGSRSCSVEYFTGKLRLTGMTHTGKGPAITTYFLWETYDVEEGLKTMQISVDLVTVRELEINAFLLDQLDVFHQYYYNRLKAIKKVHIVNHNDSGIVGLKVSFALTEVELLRDDSEIHKKCYKLLKHIYRTNESFCNSVFTSFMLKNLVLQHAVCCEGGGLGWCLLKILGDLRDKLRDEKMETPLIPYIFSTRKNLIRSDGHYRDSRMALETWNFQILWTNWDLRTYLRDLISEFIETLEKFRDGSPIPSSFQFRIHNSISFSTLSHCSG